MNENGPRKFTDNGKRGKPLYKLFAVSLLLAFAFAALPVSSAFAAPIDPDNLDSWGKKVDNLRAEMAILNNLVTQPGKFGDSEDQARFRDKYIATMRAAQTLMVSGGNVIPVTGITDTGETGIGGYYQKHPEKLLALYLHQMRKLRDKMGVTDAGTSAGTTTPSP